MPHDAADGVCPTTGRRITGEAPGARPRMSEQPPPERRPEPLGFNPVQNRIDERAQREAARAAESASSLQRPATNTQLSTRNIQQELVGQTVSERYIVKGVLGEGGMGTVYEAEHLGLGRAVAIKVLNPSQAKKRVAVKRFQQEARAAGAIGHPNICEVYDLGLLPDGSPYLVMEKLIGTTLADRISREGGLPFDEIADVMIQVLSGLIAAHDKGIVHRDIKPENIFLARRVGCPPIVKILDFGVSKMMPAFQGGDEQLDLTRTGMVMGTPYYMSPEQARGERNLDGRVDVYACGIMMYEAIVGKRPFLAPNYNALLLAIINTTPTPLRSVRPATPPELERIVAYAMAKSRGDRYPTANTMLRDVQALAFAVPAQAAMRMPAPPTAEERLRAPSLGARHVQVAELEDAPRSDETTRKPGRRHADANDGPGATLRSRMADAPAPRAADARPAERGDPSTRLDIRLKAPPPDSGSVEIPIHVMGAEFDEPSGAAPASVGEYDEMPTEVFRPGMHFGPAVPGAPARSTTATRLSPAPPPLPRGGAPPPPLPAHPPLPKVPPPPAPPAPFAAPHPPAAPAPFAAAQPPGATTATAPRQGGGSRQDQVTLQPNLGLAPLGPVDFSGLAADEWDGETVVKQPAALTTMRHRERPPREREAKPFNPDETVKLSDQDVDVDFSDETQIHLPPRRPR
jgi:serine/threonine-protein kinase